MDSLLGFADPPPPPLDIESDVLEGTTQISFKLVPWTSWAEWSFVNDSLFSSSPSSVSSALRRVVTWRSRGCVPVAVDVTASIIAIQQKDPFFRNDIAAEQSEEMLAMLYSMAIMRLVNGVVEKTRKKNETSIAQAADVIGLPRMLIDIRHEGSHRDLPSLQLVRLASTKALDWLKSYYWEPQRSAISVDGDVITNLRKDIQQKLHDLALCLNAEKNTRSSSSSIKAKRFKHLEGFGGCNKFLSFMGTKALYFKSSGSKKHIAKTVKNVLRLYSSDSSEVAYVIIEMLLKALSYSECEVSEMQALHDWKAVILKLSRKEPELLVTLLRAALNKHEMQKVLIKDKGEHLLPQITAESHQLEQLPQLFEWLLNILKHVHRKLLGAKTEGSSYSLPNATLSEFLQKCVLASSNGENQFMSSALVLAHMMGKSALITKLNKLSLLSAKDLADTEVLSFTDSESFFSGQEDSILQALKNFDLLKRRQMRDNTVEQRDSHNEVKSRWTIAKSWIQCPIGMLPHTLGFSGRLPALDLSDDDHEEVPTSDNQDQGEEDQLHRKRGPEHSVESLDDSGVKRLRETTRNCESDNEDSVTPAGVEGHLLIDGVWKKVPQEEILAISSAIRILL